MHDVISENIALQNCLRRIARFLLYNDLLLYKNITHNSNSLQPISVIYQPLTTKYWTVYTKVFNTVSTLVSLTTCCHYEFGNFEEVSLQQI